MTALTKYVARCHEVTFVRLHQAARGHAPPRQ